MPRIEVAGDICVRRIRTTRGCRGDDYDDDNNDDWPDKFRRY
jgi:hypothetical protein